MTLSARAYLSKDGAIELLCEINPSGSRYEELASEVSITRPTLAKRLAEGREVSLLARRPISGERGSTNKHVLTPRGATVRVRLFEQGVVMDYRQFRQARKRFEASSEEFTEAIATNLLDLSDTERNEQNLQTLLQRNGLSDMVDE